MSESSSSSGFKDKEFNTIRNGEGSSTGEKKKPAVVKALRACNNCRATRTRCIGCDDPPCKRCTNANLDCVFEKPPRDPGVEATERIQGLEREMGGVQSALSEILAHIRGVPMPPPSIPSLLYPRQPQQQPWNASPPLMSPPSHPTPSSSSFPANFVTSFSHYQTPSLTSPQPPSPFQNQPSLSYPPPTLQPPPTHLAPIRHLAPMPVNATASSSSSYPPPLRPSSPARSDASSDAGGELPPSALLAPLSSIQSLADAASEREHAPERSKKRDLGESNDNAVAGGSVKRVKFGDVTSRGVKPEPLNPEGGLERGQVHTFTSCLEAGLISDEEARSLHRLYWGGADQFLSVFDPKVDTYEKMKREHPFCFSAICYVASSIEDSGGPISDKQRQLWGHLKQQAMQSLFSKTVRVGAVQALLLTSGWNDSGWLCGGHAVRLGMDIGCNEAFYKLLATGMGAGKTGDELEADRVLVSKARVGFVLFNFDNQMSYGNGRTPIVQVDEAILRCQELLKHPLSIETDIKVVSTTELMTIRAKYHHELSKLVNDVTIDASTILLLDQANNEVHEWHKKWHEFSSAVPLSSDDRGQKRLREQSLLIQREYTNLFHNCFALRGVHNVVDVLKMPILQRTLALRALRNAQAALEICLAPDSYRANFRFAVHYTHVTAAFVGSLLIRIARLFPKELDLRQTAKDVDQLAGLLAEAGAGRYARSLRLMLRKARRRRVVPPSSAPPSAPGSPTSRAAPPLHPSLYPEQLNLNSHTGFPFPPHASSSLASTTANFNDVQALAFDPSAARIEIGVTVSSPSSSLLGFDWGYAQDLLGSVGMSVDEGGALPLWLSDSDLGSNQLLSGGMEDFFLPSDIDLQLDLYSANGGSSQGGQTPSALPQEFAGDPGGGVGAGGTGTTGGSSWAEWKP
ncbi:hypothetical protein BDY24DRAFT_402566 [Mrakia frigida]|uniref:uncharacterized protein n=1 Tax=Mrakia frigida TaxID=29902 RepID=UPI003FCC1E83